jgi:hypothetical protein
VVSAVSSIAGDIHLQVLGKFIENSLSGCGGGSSLGVVVSAVSAVAVDGHLQVVWVLSQTENAGLLSCCSGLGVVISTIRATAVDGHLKSFV